jgi:hypothetical protein
MPPSADTDSAEHVMPGSLWPQPTVKGQLPPLTMPEDDSGWDANLLGHFYKGRVRDPERRHSGVGRIAWTFCGQLLTLTSVVGSSREEMGTAPGTGSQADRGPVHYIFVQYSKVFEVNRKVAKARPHLESLQKS